MLPPEFPRLFESQYASYRDDLPLWLALAAEARGPVLELGCGPGRVLSALVEAGFEAEGLDNNQEMLARAARRLAPRDVPLHFGDLRAFSIGRLFALVLLPCNTLSHLDEQDGSMTLAAIHGHLLPGGRLAAELPNPRDSRAQPPDHDEPLAEFVDGESGNPVQVYAHQTLTAEARRAEVLWHYDELLPDGRVSRTSISTTYYLRNPRELRRMLNQAGFASARFFGDYDRSRYTSVSPRMILVAQRD